METLKKDFLDRIEKVKSFDSWDKRIIIAAFENSLLKYEIDKKDKKINSLKN